ncbi:hypothetical protein FHP05_14810 [Cerasibacillus terrae]|uniref:Uncharacterized protein n=1 Tax=Cerasibacillus terrae TaxID=2498845 RepID=A0A5C8NFN9_9BACI|nr:hypothetical protein [Cerasibacillus terrae]TXL57791.1 hypothetical protein FHP05_14810 [Cerasibacillus terrae]
MRDVLEDFLIAGEEIDELNSEGFFGLEAKELLMKRDGMNTSQYLYKSIKIWLESNSDKAQTKHLIKILFRLYINSLKVNPQKVIDILDAFWRGTSEQPHIEGLSAYTEFSRLFTEAKESLNDPTLGTSAATKRRVTSNISNSYSKGVEFIGKTLVNLIAIAKVANNEEFNMYRDSKLRLFDKVKKFNRLTNNQYRDITDIINRYVRNAEAHLSLTFSTARSKFVLRKRENGRLVNDYITIEEMLLKLFPSVGAYAQAFVYSGSLLVIAFDDKELFKKTIHEIYM